MHNPLFIAILAGLGGMIGWGSADFFAKNAIDRIGPIKSLVWAHAFGTVFIAIAALLHFFGSQDVTVIPQSSAWPGLVGFGILQMAVYYLAYLAFEKGQVSVLNPIFASFSGIVAVVSIIVFGASASALGVAALVILFGGVLLLNIDPRELRSTKKKQLLPGVPEIVAATLLAAVWTLGWDKFVAGQDPLSYALWMYAFMSIAALGLAAGMRQKLTGVPSGVWKYLLLMGLGEAVAYTAITWGYSSTSLTSVVALISGAFSVPTVILAYFFLRERLTRLQTGAVCAIIAGIALVALS